VTHRAQRVVSGEAVDRLADGVLEGLLGAGTSVTQPRLELGEPQFDWIEVGRVGRQVQNARTPARLRLVKVCAELIDVTTIDEVERDYGPECSRPRTQLPARFPPTVARGASGPIHQTATHQAAV
jgi:hypothetical protein